MYVKVKETYFENIQLRPILKFQMASIWKMFRRKWRENGRKIT